MRRNGWIMLEVISALCLISILAGMLAVTVQRQTFNLQDMANSRSAMRAAEDALTTLQSGGKLPTLASAKLTVTQLAVTADSPDRVWVEVHAEVSGRSATLSGLIPRAATVAMAGGNR
jgi:type II secretory pathway pseudopilin PulG